MRYILSCIFISIILFSCGSSDKVDRFFAGDADVLPAEYVINTEMDTTLVTKNGALLKIPAGSLKADGTTVTLEIQEAYSIAQMIRMGLTTTSNGELLSSGGMISIYPKQGEKVKITKLISISVPTDYIDPNMQLYKGEAGKNGNINWTDPTPLPDNAQSAMLDTGRVLFQRTCAACHSIEKEGTGPLLAHYLKRFSGEKLLARGYTLHYPQAYRTQQRRADSVYQSTTNNGTVNLSEEMWENQSLYFCNLKARYGSLGVQYPDLDIAALNNIYRYIQDESDRLKLPMPSNELDLCVDSCMTYLAQTRKLLQRKNEIENKRNSLIIQNGQMVEEKKNDFQANGAGNQLRGNGQPEGEFVTPKNYSAAYYQFTIESFGWYNIDVLVKGQNGVDETELFVSIGGDYREKVKTYLIIPSVKIYAEGGPSEKDPEVFAYLYTNGKVFLPQQARAYILAVTETDTSIAYALHPFIIGKKHEIEIALQRSTKAAFNTAMKTLNSGTFTITAADSKNAASIRETDVDLDNIQQELYKAEHLKPVKCDCDCGYSPVAAAEGEDQIVER